LSVRTAISPTLTEEFIIHPSVYSEIEKLGHAKSDVLLSESGSSLSADLVLIFSSGLHGSTAADSVRSEWPLWHAAKSKTQVFARRRIELKLKQKLLDIRAEKERSSEGERERCASRRYLLNIIVKLICKNNYLFN
ncbi:hypothetical protein TNCV_2164941, partial [Trichonephila clavipes]